MSRTATKCACECGEVFPKYDKWHRPRHFVTGHNVVRDVEGRWSARG